MTRVAVSEEAARSAGFRATSRISIPGSLVSQGMEELRMKQIKAIVRPNKVEDVREALEKLNLGGMTVTDVRGHGRQKGHTAVYRGKEYEVSLIPKVEIVVVVGDDVVDEVIAAMVRAARTGEIGDGRVFVLPVEQAYNIRTGERNVI
jgi:nitrogen regulatory protein P-II 1